MKVSFSTAINKGKQEFNKLSQTERAIKIGVEKFRQNYNKTHTPILSAPKNNIGKFIRFKVSIKQALEKALKKI